MKKVPDIIKLARRKLRDNQTVAESIVWNQIRAQKLGIKFQRQFPLYLYTEDSGLDRYIIPDFYCSEKKLIIEIDGDIHDRKDIYELDKYKQQILLDQGYTIIRFKNLDIIDNISKSLEKIAASCSGKDKGETERSDNFEVEAKQGEFKRELETKRFIMKNESFICDNCGKTIEKHPTGSARNHCPHCLHSKHLDKDFPGDRASDCHSLMKPVGKDYHKNKGWMVIHECQKCHKKIPNKLAEDDNIDVFSEL